MKVYEIITERILELLSKGVAPWQQPWRNVCYSGQCGAVFNLKSKKPYRGLNVFLLTAAGFSSPFWATFKQIKEMGGIVRPGSKGTQVVFWKFLEREVEGTTKVKKIPMLRYYTVFNVDQTEGLEGKVPQPDGEPTKPAETITLAEALVAEMPKRPEIRKGGDKAYYQPAYDVVGIPTPENFNSPELYYKTLFHELAHSTSHEGRVGRPISGDMRSPVYAKEELIAEMTAAFLCGHVGIDSVVIENTASYLQFWSDTLKSDPKMVVTAAGAAQKAADYVLGKGVPVD